MSLFVRAFTRQNIVAIAIGVLVAGAPLVAFNFWLSGVIDRQGQAEIDASAKRAVLLAEQRVGMVLSTLDDLAARGVDSCEAADVEALQQAAFLTAPIKEIAIVSQDGQGRCSNHSSDNNAVGQRRLLSSEPLAGAAAYTIDIVRVAGGQHMLQFRRPANDNGNEIVALMPANLLLPQTLSRGEMSDSYAQIETHEGAMVANSGQRTQGDARDMFFSMIQSDKYGFRVEFMALRSAIIAGKTDLKWVGLFITFVIVAILAAIGMLMPRRVPNNPVAEIERGLANGEFIPYYQPVVDIRSGQLRGAEVLVRWRKPDGTLVLPGSFIPLAESSGLIRALTFDLMRRVCAEAGAIIGLRPALKISFNFAGMLFSDETIVRDVRNLFAGSPIKLSQVVLEVTERDPIENFTLTRQVIAALQGLGVRIAIDDVGTGHSGLSYMLKLGVDIIKIDKMFVDAIGTDRNSTTIVETLVDLAHNMRMDVVAEGVENFEQVMHLRDLGVRSAQGYVFAPPLPSSAFFQLVQAMDSLGAENRDAAERRASTAAA
jgi:sensor c-di-GMP phosphodiesterase-like protein